MKRGGGKSNSEQVALSAKANLNLVVHKSCPVTLVFSPLEGAHQFPHTDPVVLFLNL